MESFTDPESLRPHEEIEFQREVEVLDEEEFEATRENLRALDSHVVVGIVNNKGEVLLQNDGHHGWTLTASPVEHGEDWVAAGRNEVESLTGATIEIDGAERVRRIDYCLETENAPQTIVYNVVLSASPLAGETIVVNPTGPNEDGPAVEWFDEAPTNQNESIRDDIRLFLG